MHILFFFISFTPSAIIYSDTFFFLHTSKKTKNSIFIKSTSESDHTIKKYRTMYKYPWIIWKLQFLKRLIILAFHLTSLSLAVYLRPSNTDAQLLKWPEEITEVARTIAECITVLGVLSYILVQLGGEIINIGLLSFMKQLVREDLVSWFRLSVSCESKVAFSSK